MYSDHSYWRIIADTHVRLSDLEILWPELKLREGERYRSTPIADDSVKLPLYYPRFKFAHPSRHHGAERRR